MFDKRGAGVIMHISSLPSEYGIGVFGQSCFDFVEKLASMNFKYWQVLPFNPVDDANSPYCSASAFAGNILFIDPAQLVEMGLCTREEAQANVYDGTPYTADFDFAKKARLSLLKKAFSRIDTELARQIKDFEAENKWLTAFAYFMAIKEANDFRPWWEWDEEFARYDIFKRRHRHDYAERSAFWKFCQYIFFEQWNKVKAYANSKDIKIIGDMPIYVAMDSVDVWSALPMFLIDEKTLSPEKVAGVPPDYFSEDGQLWGNPIYNWDAMEKDGYKWWLSRIGHALNTYDVVRIDHFRAFASYWEVPADAETAKTGEWKDGPGMKLFRKVFRKFPDAPIIAEDLGVFGEDVVKLLEDTGFPGMKVVQFGFDPDGDSSHMPHNAGRNSINYVGTHDNNTLLGWLWEASENERRFALDYVGFEGDNWGDGGYYSKSCRRIIECVWRSSSVIAMVAFQDLCGFGSDARMNIPGVPEKNWRFRTTQDTINGIDADYFRRINALYKR